MQYKHGLKRSCFNRIVFTQRIYLLPGIYYNVPDYDEILQKNRGGGLVFEVEYYPRKKIHEIRVVFHPGFSGPYTCVPDVHCGHRLGVQKTCKIEKKACFCYVDKFWKGHDHDDRQIKKKKKKKTCNNAHFRIYFHPRVPWAYVLRVCFETPFPGSFYEEDTHPEIQVPPPG